MSIVFERHCSVHTSYVINQCLENKIKIKNEQKQKLTELTGKAKIVQRDGVAAPGELMSASNTWLPRQPHKWVGGGVDARVQWCGARGGKKAASHVYTWWLLLCYKTMALR